jgi:protein gp37
MKTTKIEWTDSTWNPITGCTKISEGCKNCYAELMTKRLVAMGQDKYKNGFKVTTHENTLSIPLQWKKSHKIFVCSMSDLFHEDVPFSFIDKVMNIIISTPQHQYQLLTKRAENMERYFHNKTVPSNIWLGVTVESQEVKNRISFLNKIDATIRFLSCEPLLEDLGELDLSYIDWVIVGGESGNKARPMKQEWILSIEKQSKANDVAFFFKQWGTWGSDGKKRNKHANGKLLNGQIRQELPFDTYK